MQTRKHDQAFPMFDEEFNINETGLTKREYFALKIHQAILSNPNRTCLLHKVPDLAAKQADLLIQALNETSSNGN